MYHEFFAKSPLLSLPILALVIFIAVFALVVVRTLGKKGREAANAASRLPLEDDLPVPPPVVMVPVTVRVRERGRHE